MTGACEFSLPASRLRCTRGLRVLLGPRCAESPSGRSPPVARHNRGRAGGAAPCARGLVRAFGGARRCSDGKRSRGQRTGRSLAGPGGLRSPRASAAAAGSCGRGRRRGGRGGPGARPVTSGPPRGGAEMARAPNARRATAFGAGVCSPQAHPSRRLGRRRAPRRGVLAARASRTGDPGAATGASLLLRVPPPVASQKLSHPLGKRLGDVPRGGDVISEWSPDGISPWGRFIWRFRAWRACHLGLCSRGPVTFEQK